MRRCAAILGGFLLLAASAAWAQSASYRGTGIMHEDAPALDGKGLPPSNLLLNTPVAPPRMAPDLALSTYLNFARQQLTQLGAYSDATVIEADLPDTAQHGKYELRRTFHAPRTLAFAAMHFAGDSFVKTNVIARLLQSEVDHVQKGQGELTAITADNYKFSLKGTELVDGRVAYVYHIKPRHKRVGLFKGKILIDAGTGRLRRAEGSMAKSPSLFVKKVEFVQDYSEFGPFSLPVHVHSVARTRLVGRALVDIYHTSYETKTVDEVQAEAHSASSSGSGGSSSSSSNN